MRGGMREWNGLRANPLPEPGRQYRSAVV